MTTDSFDRRYIVSKSHDAKIVRTGLLLFLSITIAFFYFVYIVPSIRNSTIFVVGSLFGLLVLDYLIYIFVLSLISGIPFFELIKS